jgi:hypothetical protein
MARSETGVASNDAARIAALEAQVRGLLDREEIRDVITAYGRSLDARDWTTQRTLYTDPFDMDYSSIGVPGRTIAVDDWVALLSSFFAQLPATQHMTNTLELDVRGDDAVVVAMLHAQHFLPNDKGDSVQRMIGTYDVTLRRTAHGWKIGRIALKAQWHEGNYWIYEEANRRAQQG